MHKGRNRRPERRSPHGKPWGTVAVRDRRIKGTRGEKETGKGETGEKETRGREERRGEES